VFKSKIIISTTIFLILLITISIIKNKTRIIEKNIFSLNKKIVLKEKDINESQLDFYFLASPSEIEKKIKILGQNSYSPIKNSKIFLKLSNFKNFYKKISAIDTQDEKKKN